MYTEIVVKSVYIHNYELKTHVQKERSIEIKENIQVETNFTPIKHYQEKMPSNPTPKQEKKRNSESLNADRKPPKDNY